MELTALRYFVTVAKELHFRNAAKKLNMTQGPLSSAIRKLEEELETVLFERSSRWVKLTAGGEFFLHEAEDILQRAALAKENLSKFMKASSPHLVIGYNESALNTVLPRLLSFWNEKMAHIELELRELETSEQIKALQAGTLDMGFMRPYGFELGDLCSKRVHRERYCLVFRCDHALASCEKITLEMLSRQDIVLFARDVNPELFDLLCAKMTPPGGQRPNFRQSARTKSSMLAMVRAGFGAALLPESSLHTDLTGLVAAQTAFDLPYIDIMAVWNRAKVPPMLQEILKNSCCAAEENDPD